MVSAYKVNRTPEPQASVGSLKQKGLEKEEMAGVLGLLGNMESPRERAEGSTKKPRPEASGLAMFEGTHLLGRGGRCWLSHPCYWHSPVNTSGFLFTEF